MEGWRFDLELQNREVIPTYPRRGHVDVIKLGQEDEATPDPDGALWDTGEDEAEGGEAATEGDENEEVEAVPSMIPAIGFIQNFRSSSTECLKWMFHTMVMVMIRRGRRV